MSETTALTNEATQLLIDLRLLLERGGNFVVEQAPPLAREIITYGRIANTLSLFVCLLIFTICLRFYFTKLPQILNGKECRDRYGELPGRYIAQTIAYGIFGVVFGISSFADAFDAAKAWFAPRLYLVEYVGRLINGGCR